MKTYKILLLLGLLSIALESKASVDYFYCKMDAGYVQCRPTTFVDLEKRKIPGIELMLCNMDKLSASRLGVENNSLQRRNQRIIDIPSKIEVFSYSILANTYDIHKSIGIHTITGIGKKAFADCDNAEIINLPSTIKYIGAQTFLNCKNLRTVNLPESIEAIDADAFDGCTSLEQINIGKNGQKNKAGFYSLNGVLCKEGKIYLVPNNFKSSTNPNEFIVPSNIIGIGDRAFANNPKITKVNIPNGTIDNLAFKNCQDLKEVVLGNGVTSVGESAFEGCFALEKIDIPPSVKSLGKRSFYGCMSLSSITIGGGLQKIEASSFENCAALQSITIPKSITTIGANAFRGCTSLKNVVFPISTSGLDTIDEGTFSFCESLREIKFPVGIKYISKNAFLSCTALGRVVLNADLQSIWDYAFMGCSNLTTINIPAKTIVTNAAFLECPKLIRKRK